MKRYLYKFFLFIGLLFGLINIQCSKKPTFSDHQREELESTIKKFDIDKRLIKWDSLIFENKLNEPLQAYFWFDKAYDLTMLNKNREAIKAYDNALSIFKKNQIEEMEAKTLVNLSNNYINTDEKGKATEVLMKGLDIANKLNDDYIKSRVYNGLARLYYLNSHYNKAIDCLEKGKEIYKKSNDSDAIAIAYNNISLIYREQHNLKKAYENAFKAVEYDSLNNKKTRLIKNYTNLGVLTQDYLKNKDKALYYYQKALNLSNKFGVNPGYIYENISNLYSEYKKNDSALFYMNKVLNLPEENLNQKINNYGQAIALNIKMGHNKIALKLLKIKDSLQQVQNKKIEQENNKNIENNLALLDKQKQLLQIKQLNQKNRVIFIFIIITFLLGLFISFQLNKMDRLALQQERFILESKVLRSQMNPHFIFNVLSSIQNSLFENKPMVSATYLSKFAKLIRQNFDYIQKRQISLKEELSMIHNYINAQEFRYKGKFSYKVILDEAVNSDVLIPPMILQPFVENAIEHGFKNIDYQGQLIIKIYKKNKKLLCFEIIDNGIGFSPKKEDKEHALDVFKKRLKLLGKDAIESFKITKLEKGTKFSFCIPVK